ncbi:hypothetical protein F4802DRAFT_250835 [Xylaria palmicola]|nr:hypothetical protein F4802DRAFT_250835 [Xylaria palmicola]
MCYPRGTKLSQALHEPPKARLACTLGFSCCSRSDIAPSEQGRHTRLVRFSKSRRSKSTSSGLCVGEKSAPVTCLAIAFEIRGLIGSPTSTKPPTQNLKVLSCPSDDIKVTVLPMKLYRYPYGTLNGTNLCSREWHVKVAAGLRVCGSDASSLPVYAGHMQIMSFEAADARTTILYQLRQPAKLSARFRTYSSSHSVAVVIQSCA